MKNEQSKKKVNGIDLKSIIQNGGATLNKNGKAVTFARGYQVSQKDCYKLDVKNIDAIYQAIKKTNKKIPK